MEKDFVDANKEFDGVQTVTENIDNLLKKNNIQIHGLQEGSEEENLVSYLEELFTDLSSSAFCDFN